MKKLASISLLLALAWPAQAQWFNDPYRGMAPVCMAPGQQVYPVIGRLGSQYTVFFWLDYRVPGEMRAYYQVLDQQGVRQLDLDGLPLIEGPYWYTAVTAAETDIVGGVTAIFRDRRDGAEEDLYGQRFDSLGNSLWGPTGAPVATWPRNEDTNFEDSAVDSLGNLFVGWSQAVMFGNSNFVQKVNLDGERLWGDYGVLVCNGPWFTGFSEKVVPDGQGGVMVIWDDERAGPNNGHLYFQHFDSLGNAQLPPNGVPVLYPSGSQMGANIEETSPDGHGGCICYRHVSEDPPVPVVFRLSGSGNTQWCWTQLQYDNLGGNFLAHPQIGRIFMLSWEIRNPGGNWRPYLYCWDLNGLPLFGHRGLPDINGGYLVPTSDGVIAIRSCEVVWSIMRIPAVRVDTMGHKIWQTNVAVGRMVMGNPGFIAMACVSNGADGAIVALRDYRELPSDLGDLSAQRVLANGQLGGPAPPARAVAPSNPNQTLSVSQNIIRYELPISGRVSLVLYNLLGQQVAVLEEGDSIAGTYTVCLLTSINSPQEYIFCDSPPLPGRRPPK